VGSTRENSACVYVGQARWWFLFLSIIIIISWLVSGLSEISLPIYIRWCLLFNNLKKLRHLKIKLIYWFKHNKWRYFQVENSLVSFTSSSNFTMHWFFTSSCGKQLHPMATYSWSYIYITHWHVVLIKTKAYYLFNKDKNDVKKKNELINMDCDKKFSIAKKNYDNL